MIEISPYKSKYQPWFSVDAFCYLVIFGIKILDLELRRIHLDQGNF